MSLLGFLTGCHCGKNVEKNNTNQTQEEPKAKPTMPKGKLLVLNYNFSGMAMMPISDFELERKAEETNGRFTFQGYGEKRTYEVPDSFFVAVKDLLEKEKMYEYASSYTPRDNDRILDGYHWSLWAYFEGKERISSGGHNGSPSGNGLNHLEGLLIDTAKELMKANGVEMPF